MNRIKKNGALLVLLTGIELLACFPALAGDGATILFREGQMAYINNGYSQLVDAYKSLNKQSSEHNIIELKIESSPFLINLAEVVLICRDRCSSLEVIDPRRAPEAKSKVTVNR